MACFLIAALAIVWVVSAIFSVVLDRKMFPKPVVPGADELLLAVTCIAGPIGLAAIYWVYLDAKSKGGAA